MKIDEKFLEDLQSCRHKNEEEEGFGSWNTGRSRPVTSLDSPGEQATDDVLLEEQSKDNRGNHCEDPGSDDGDIADIKRRGEHPSDHGAGVGLLSLSDQ